MASGIAASIAFWFWGGGEPAFHESAAMERLQEATLGLSGVFFLASAISDQRRTRLFGLLAGITAFAFLLREIDGDEIGPLIAQLWLGSPTKVLAGMAIALVGLVALNLRYILTLTRVEVMDVMRLPLVAAVLLIIGHAAEKLRFGTGPLTPEVFEEGLEMCGYAILLGAALLAASLTWLPSMRQQTAQSAT